MRLSVWKDVIDTDYHSSVWRFLDFLLCKKNFRLFITLSQCGKKFMFSNRYSIPIILSSSIDLFARSLVQGHHRRQSLHKRRMGIMVHTVQWIWAHGAQVFEVNLTQPTLQVLTHVQVNRKLIRSEFALSAEDGQHEWQNFINRCPECLEEQQQSDDGWNIRSRGIEPKCSIQVLRRIALGEEIKGDTEVDLRDSKVSEGMSEFPMPKLMSQNGEDFTLLYLFQKGVEKNCNLWWAPLLVVS